MTTTSPRLSILRAAERLCLDGGIDRFALADIAKALGEPLATIQKYFRDEISVLDAVLERHLSAYEDSWAGTLEGLTHPRDVIELLARTIVARAEDEDGGAAYVRIAAQMCTSTRHTLTGRPATTSPRAMLLMAKLMSASKVPVEVLPIRFERFAVTLFASVAS